MKSLLLSPCLPPNFAGDVGSVAPLLALAALAAAPTSPPAATAVARLAAGFFASRAVRHVVLIVPDELGEDDSYHNWRMSVEPATSTANQR